MGACLRGMCSMDLQIDNSVEPQHPPRSKERLSNGSLRSASSLRQHSKLPALSEEKSFKEGAFDER